MQPKSQSYPQPPLFRRKSACRRFRDRRRVRLAHTSARGLLTGGLALILLGGSQTAIYAVGQPAATRRPLQQSGSVAAWRPGQPAGSSIDGGSLPLGGGSPPPPSSAPVGPTASPSPTTTPSPTAGGRIRVVVGGVPISVTVLAAYLNAQRRLAASDPGCHLPWQLLAGIGEVESGQAEGGDVTADGTARTPILGPLLNGNGFAAVRAADGSWARAQGPMQFIPSTWAIWGVDGSGDGKADPENVFDAALSAAGYLCSGGRNLRNSADLDHAILGYNDSQAYLADVLAWMRYYQRNGALPGAPGAAGSPSSPVSGSTSSGRDSTSGGSKGTGGSRGGAVSTPTTSPIRSTRPTAPSPHPSPTGSTPTSRPSPTPSRPTASPSPTRSSSQPSAPSSSATNSTSSTASPSVSSSSTSSPSSSCPDSSPEAIPAGSSSPAAVPTASSSPAAIATASSSPSPSPTPTCP